MSVTGTVTVNDIQPTAPQFERKRETKTLEPWENTIEGEHYSQKPFFDYGPTYVNATCGLGAGKTVMGIIRAVANAEYWNPGYPGMIISPTVPNLKNAILPEMRKWGILDDWEYKGKGSDEPGLHSPNGTRIILESADNDRKIGRLRGPSVAWVWMDEPAEVSERAFDVAIGRVRTGNYQNVFVTGTPKGYNWVYEKFHPEGERTLSNVKNVFGIPSFANPHNPASYKDILSSYSGQFYKQEALGEFVKFEGLVYDWFDDSNTVAREDVPNEYDETVYGIDWGGTHPSVIVALRKAGDMWYVTEAFYERRCTVGDMANYLLGEGDADGMIDRHGPGPIYCDPSEPASMETLRRKGAEQLNKADNSVDAGIRHVYGKEDTLRVAKTCQNVINEFNSYQYKDGSDTVVKENDHSMDAIRYAIFTHETEGETGFYFTTA